MHHAYLGYRYLCRVYRSRAKWFLPLQKLEWDLLTTHSGKPQSPWLQEKVANWIAAESAAACGVSHKDVILGFLAKDRMAGLSSSFPWSSWDQETLLGLLSSLHLCEWIWSHCCETQQHPKPQDKLKWCQQHFKKLQFWATTKLLSIFHFPSLWCYGMINKPMSIMLGYKAPGEPILVS